MADIETVNVLKIDASQGITTLRELKEDIKRNQDALVALGLVEKDDAKKKAEQDRITKQLEQDTKLLNQVMAASKVTTLESAKAIDTETASYYDLQKSLTTLKRAWKEMSAEERKSAEGQEILQKIKDLDYELKALDADIGQFQRNVGNYGMTFKQAMDEAQKGAQGLNQGMVALSSIMMITNTQSEGTKKAIAGMQASVMLLSSLKGISGLTEAVKKSNAAAKIFGVTEKAATAATNAETTAVVGKTVAMEADAVATDTATTATEKWKYALLTTGIGLILVIIGELAALIMTVSDNMDKASAETKAMKEELDGLTESLEDNINMMKAQGATAEEVLNKEIEYLDEIVNKYQDYFDKLYEETGILESSDRLEAWEAYKDKADELKNKLNEAKYALVGFISSANTKKAQADMSDLEKQIDDIKRRSQQLKDINDKLYDEGIIDIKTYIKYKNQLAEAEQIEIEAAQKAAKNNGSSRYKIEK